MMIMALICIEILFSLWILFFTPLWSVFIFLSFIYLASYLDHTEETGKRRWKWFRDKIITIGGKNHKFSIIQSKVDINEPRLYLIHPYPSIRSMIMCDFNDSYVLPYEFAWWFRIPLIRELLLWSGAIHPSKMIHLLTNTGNGAISLIYSPKPNSTVVATVVGRADKEIYSLINQGITLFPMLVNKEPPEEGGRYHVSVGEIILEGEDFYTCLQSLHCESIYGPLEIV